jgi:hypothetical protein
MNEFTPVEANATYCFILVAFNYAVEVGQTYSEADYPGRFTIIAFAKGKFQLD